MTLPPDRIGLVFVFSRVTEPAQPHRTPAHMHLRAWTRLLTRRTCLPLHTAMLPPAWPAWIDLDAILMELTESSAGAGGIINAPCRFCQTLVGN
jgi:hypothetical protein